MESAGHQVPLKQCPRRHADIRAILGWLQVVRQSIHNHGDIFESFPSSTNKALLIGFAAKIVDVGQLAHYYMVVEW